MNDLFENLFIGIVSSVLTVMLLTFIANLRSYLRLIRFNGSYSGYDIENNIHLGRTYFFFYSFWNLFSIQNKIKMHEMIEGKITWQNIIYVDNSNPIVSTGCFDYLDHYGWGIHKIELNEKKTEIFVTAYNKLNSREYPYRLKRNS